MENFIRLACGNWDLPVIVLRNPQYDNLPFYSMNQKCWTLSWFCKELQRLGLTIDEVVILDAIPLLSDAALASIRVKQGRSKVLEALEDAQACLSTSYWS